MKQSIKKKMEGFTIIEVMIVLAIAGLIMLIVFLAVPALQRNSRNTQRKNDVSTYAAAVNEWSQNNQGKMPSTIADTTAINSLANIGFLTVPTTAPLSGAVSSAVNIDTFQLVTRAKCGSDGNTTLGPNRAFAIRYAVENSSGGAVPQCQEG